MTRRLIERSQSANPPGQEEVKRPPRGCHLRAVRSLVVIAAIATSFGFGATESSVLTYHSHANRDGNFIVPALTYERARALHRDERFDGRVSGSVNAQPLYWHAAGSD